MLILLFTVMSIWFIYQFFKQIGNVFKDQQKEEPLNILSLQSFDRELLLIQKMDRILDQIEINMKQAQFDQERWQEQNRNVDNTDQIVENTMKQLGLEIK